MCGPERQGRPGPGVVQASALGPGVPGALQGPGKEEARHLGGDLNVAHTELDLANPKSNVGRKGFTQEERAGFQAFIDAGFGDTFRIHHTGNGFYSWWAPFANARARNIGWRIDYILVSKRFAKKVVAAEIHPKVMGSDHCPVSVELAG